jgi:hypothetical protein
MNRLGSIEPDLRSKKQYKLFQEKNMKIKFTTIVAGTILAIAAVTGAILPASAIGTNPVVQQTMNGKTDSLLLAVTGEGEHTKNARPSTNNTHQNGKAHTQQHQVNKQLNKAGNPNRLDKRTRENQLKTTDSKKQTAPISKKDKKGEAIQKKNELKVYKAGGKITK